MWIGRLDSPNFRSRSEDSVFLPSIPRNVRVRPAGTSVPSRLFRVPGFGASFLGTTSSQTIFHPSNVTLIGERKSASDTFASWRVPFHVCHFLVAVFVAFMNRTGFVVRGTCNGICYVAERPRRCRTRRHPQTIVDRGQTQNWSVGLNSACSGVRENGVGFRRSARNIPGETT